MDPERDQGVRGPELDRSPLAVPWGRGILFCFCALVLAGWTWRYRQFFIDDPYITFRYARNLVEGNDLVFNPGQRVEGYSNFLWVLLSAGFIKLGINPMGGARVVGLACALVTFGVLCFARKTPRDAGEETAGGDAEWLFPAASAALLAGSYPFLVWATGGLETPLYALEALLLVVQLARLHAEPGVGAAARVGGLMFLLAVTRPEGFAFAAALPMAGLLWFRDVRHRRALLLALALFAVPFAAYSLWRWSYFGALVPNTVSAKVGGGLKTSLRDGLGYLLAVWSRTTGLRLQGYFWGPAFIVVLLAARGFIAAWRERREPGLPLFFYALLFVKLQGLFILAVGGDWMPAFRFVAPMLPLLAVIAGIGASRVHFMLAWPFVLFLVLAAPLSARHERVQGYTFLEWTRLRGNEERAQLQAMATDVRALAPEGSWLAATEAGYLPYYTGLPFHDMLGLVDPEIASLKGGLHKKFDAGRIERRAPAFILLGTVKNPDGSLAGLWPPDAQMLSLPAFKNAYEPIHDWPRLAPDPDGHAIDARMILYKRRTADLPEAVELEAD